MIMVSTNHPCLSVGHYRGLRRARHLDARRTAQSSPNEPVAHKASTGARETARREAHGRRVRRRSSPQEPATHKASIEPAAARSPPRMRLRRRPLNPSLTTWAHSNRGRDPTPPGVRREGRREGPAAALIDGLYRLCRSPSPAAARRGRRDQGWRQLGFVFHPESPWHEAFFPKA
jgi:hypothetical protein